MFGIISILGFLVLGIINHFLPITKYMLFNMTFDLIGMILYTPHYAISSLLNALGAYRELTIIAHLCCKYRHDTGSHIKLPSHNEPFPLLQI